MKQKSLFRTGHRPHPDTVGGLCDVVAVRERGGGGALKTEEAEEPPALKENSFS